MTNYDLAIDEDGEPFHVPTQVAGWRVRRAADGRGRPVLVHDKGKPLVVRTNATHAELLAAAGPGRYRLEAVDEHWHKVDGVPVACTGPLAAGDGPSDDDASDEMPGGPSARPISYESVLCHMVTSQTRMMERTIGQLGAVMSGVAELLNAAHNAGITSRVPPPQLPPPVVPVPIESDEDDDDHDEAEEAEIAQTEAGQKAAGSGVSEVVKLIIKETIEKLVPLIFEKFTGGNGNGTAPGGLPLEAIFDWRKAVPNGVAASSTPAAVTVNAPVAPYAPVTANAPASRGPTATNSDHGTLPTDAVPISPAAVPIAGVAPSPDGGLGAAPAGLASTPAVRSPETQEEAAALLGSHLRQVWQGLSPPERQRATQLVMQLGSEERTAWLAKLVRLSVPDAIALARAYLDVQSATATPQPPSATPQGDPQ
jgi:hypothetical protein